MDKSQVAQSKTRDTFGKFIKINQQSEDNENLVDIKVHNPLKKLYQFLDSIKKRSVTTISFKVSIPLLVLPLVVAAIFGYSGFKLGRVFSPICQSFSTSKTGVLYLHNVTEPESDNLFTQIIPFWPQSEVKMKLVTFLSGQDSDYTLVYKVGINLQQFNQRHVAVYGEYNPCTQSLTVSSPKTLCSFQRLNRIFHINFPDAIKIA